VEDDVAMLSNQLFVGIRGHAVAIDASTGEELWRTKLKGGNVATIATSGGNLYAGAGGEVFRLDPSTGEILWRNKLPGLGLGIVAFAGSEAVVAANRQQQQSHSAAV
jgi:outer membrane protein assembly factor BamB